MREKSLFKKLKISSNGLEIGWKNCQDNFLTNFNFFQNFKKFEEISKFRNFLV